MVDRNFGHWMAGFIDGEGCFYITRDTRRGVYRARFSLSVRADDAPILDELRAKTGIGTRHEYAGQSGEMVARWMVQSRADCERLVMLLEKYPLRAKKLRDFKVWSEAVRTQREIRAGRADNSDVRARMAALKDDLAVVRREGL